MGGVGEVVVADLALKCGLRGETGFHLHRSLLIVSETDCLAFTVADPFLRVETLNIPSIQPVQENASELDVDSISSYC